MCSNEGEKEQIITTENNKEHSDLTWFINEVLATSTSRERKKSFIALTKFQITDVYNSKRRLLRLGIYINPIQNRKTRFENIVA